MKCEKLNLQDRYKKTEDKKKAKVLEDFSNNWNEQITKRQEEQSRRFKEYLKQKHEREQQTNDT